MATMSLGVSGLRPPSRETILNPDQIMTTTAAAEKPLSRLRRWAGIVGSASVMRWVPGCRECSHYHRPRNRSRRAPRRQPHDKKAGSAIFCALDAPARRDRCGRRAGSIRRTVLVEEAPLAVDEGGEQIVVGVGDFVARRAVADFQNQHVFAGFVQQLAGIASACPEAGAHAGRQAHAAFVGTQGGRSGEDVDQFVLPGMRMAQGRDRTGRQAREVAAEVGQADGVAKGALLASGQAFVQQGLGGGGGGGGAGGRRGGGGGAGGGGGGGRAGGARGGRGGV